MGFWCTRMSPGAWALMAAVWAVVIGLAVWAVCRLFPAQRSGRDGEEAAAVHGGSSPVTRSSAPDRILYSRPRRRAGQPRPPACGRQTSSRFSISVTTASITMTKTVRINMPAKTPVTSKTLSASWIL